jgi:hypothetical protein
MDRRLHAFTLNLAAQWRRDAIREGNRAWLWNSWQLVQDARRERMEAGR